MRIGFDAKRYFHNQTGLGNYSRSLIHSICNEDSENQNQYFLFDKKGNPGIEVPKNAEIIRPKGRGILWRQVGIVRNIENLQLDVYHGLSAELPLSGPRNTSLVMTVHDLIFLKYPSYYSFFDRFFYTYKLRSGVSLANRIICTSDRTRKDLIEIFPACAGKTEVVYQSCHPLFYSRSSKQDLEKCISENGLPQQFSLCVNSFDERKNHVRLLQAYAKNHQKLMPLVLVGKSGKMLSTITQMVAQLGLNKKVFILDNVKLEELHILYQSAAYSIAPSEYEGFGIPVLESLASGSSAVVSKSSSMSEISRTPEAEFDPLNIDEIASTLVSMENESFRKELLIKQTDHLSEFDPKRIAQKHLMLYQEISGS